jgi:hypothetical protein
MTCMQLLEPCPNDAGQVRQNFRQIVCKKGPKSTDKPNTFSATTIKPIETMPGWRFPVRMYTAHRELRHLHSIYRLQHLLRSCLKGQDSIWRIIQFFDLFRVGNEDVSVVRSREFKRLPLCFVECILDDLWAPEKERPCLITLDQRPDNVFYNLCHTGLSLLSVWVPS